MHSGLDSYHTLLCILTIHFLPLIGGAVSPTSFSSLKPSTLHGFLSDLVIPGISFLALTGGCKGLLLAIPSLTILTTVLLLYVSIIRWGGN